MGLASLMGQFYGPVHSVLPFLLLGLGIDDAFVIANQVGAAPPSAAVLCCDHRLSSSFTAFVAALLFAHTPLTSPHLPARTAAADPADR